MIPKEEILARANQQGIAAVMIEKDYVLGWILNAISTHPSLKNSWVFKGGTCLGYLPPSPAVLLNEPTHYSAI